MSKPTDLLQGPLDLLILKVIALEPMQGRAIEWHGPALGIASAHKKKRQAHEVPALGERITNSAY